MDSKISVGRRLMKQNDEDRPKSPAPTSDCIEPRETCVMAWLDGASRESEFAGDPANALDMVNCSSDGEVCHLSYQASRYCRCLARPVSAIGEARPEVWRWKSNRGKRVIASCVAVTPSQLGHDIWASKLTPSSSFDSSVGRAQDCNCGLSRSRDFDLDVTCSIQVRRMTFSTLR